MERLLGIFFGVFVVTIVANSSDWEEWNAFKLKYEKNYSNATEDEKRMTIFLKNKHRIDEHNEKHESGSVSYKLGLNEFSDLTPEEFSAQMKGFRPPSLLTSIHIENKMEHFHGSRYEKNLFDHHDYHHHMLKSTHLPKSVDWRHEGAVIGGKMQGDCGSCWAFATSGAIEGHYFRKTGKLVRFSEQNLLDCVFDCGCSGCTLPEAYDYVRDNGIETAENYPGSYVHAKENCRSNSASAVNITGFKRIPEGNEYRLQEALATVGPVSVSIDASNFSFMHYRSGIYFEQSCSSHNLDHAVLAVGYGVDKNGEEYYILRNWWGDDWGENGDFRMKRNQCNHCGIASEAMYPIL